MRGLSPVSSRIGTLPPTREKRHGTHGSLPPEGTPPPTRGKRPRFPLSSRRIGTPPPTRREQDPQPPPDQAEGSTPAYAGKTQVTAFDLHAPTKHPRLREENARPSLRALLPPWNTPAYAKKTPGRDLRAEEGNTPAYAERTKRRSCARHRPREHPRLRGENSAVVHLRFDSPGTPPPTRRERAWRRRPRLSRLDHPRLRGENGRKKAPRLSPEGTPPPTRRERFLTCAGNTGHHIIHSLCTHTTHHTSNTPSTTPSP